MSSVEATALARATTSPFNVRTATVKPLFILVSRDKTPGAVRVAPWQTASTAESLT